MTYIEQSHTIRGMRINKKKLLTFGLVGVIVVLLAAVIFLAWQYQKVSKSPSEESKKTSSRIIDKVSKIYLLPAGEEPTVAVIQDKSKLGNQEFFKNAKNGDYLLIYKEEKVALVYREEANRLVNVGPVNLDAQEGQNGETAGAQTDGAETPPGEGADNP